MIYWKRVRHPVLVPPKVVSLLIVHAYNTGFRFETSSTERFVVLLTTCTLDDHASL